MKASARAEIKRIIGNRHGEAHPFKHGSAGMEWFSRMCPLVDQLTAEEMQNFLLPMVDDLFESVPHCRLCQAKLLVFAEIFCCRGAPLQAKEYWQQYRVLVSFMEIVHSVRDFRAEVYEAMDRYCGQGE